MPTPREDVADVHEADPVDDPDQREAQFVVEDSSGAAAGGHAVVAERADARSARSHARVVLPPAKKRSLNGIGPPKPRASPRRTPVAKTSRGRSISFVKPFTARRLQREIVEVLPVVLAGTSASAPSHAGEYAKACEMNDAAGRVEHFVARLAGEGAGQRRHRVVSSIGAAQSRDRSAGVFVAIAVGPDVRLPSSRSCWIDTPMRSTSNGLGDIGLRVALLAVVQAPVVWNGPVAQRSAGSGTPAPRAAARRSACEARRRARCRASCVGDSRRCRRGRARCRRRAVAHLERLHLADGDVDVDGLMPSPAAWRWCRRRRRPRGVRHGTDAQVDHRKGAGVVEVAPRPAQRATVERAVGVAARAARGRAGRSSGRCPATAMSATTDCGPSRSAK